MCTETDGNHPDVLFEDAPSTLHAKILAACDIELNAMVSGSALVFMG